MERKKIILLVLLVTLGITLCQVNIAGQISTTSLFDLTEVVSTESTEDSRNPVNDICLKVLDSTTYSWGTTEVVSTDTLDSLDPLDSFYRLFK